MNPAARLSRPPSSAAVQDAAADWLVRRNAGLPPADAGRLEAWLAADPRHRAAFAELEGAWAALSFPSAAGQVDEAKRRLAERARRRGRNRLVAGAASAGLAAVLMLAFVVLPTRFEPVAPALASGVSPRPNLQLLPDGSTVELNADAEIVVEFSPARRGVRLLRGEALFDVKKDVARPFVVAAGGVTVRAVGTAFAVRHDASEIGVLVTEGRVAVERTAAPAAAAPADPIFVGPGGQVAMPADPARPPVVAPAPLSAPQMAAVLAWRGRVRRVEFTRTTLTDAVVLFNGQNRVQIAIADPTVGQIAISGVFWADDPESFVRLLESGFNVQADRTGGPIVLRAR